MTKQMLSITKPTDSAAITDHATLTTSTERAWPANRGSDLERQAISFTVGLYLFICIALLVVHYAGPHMPQANDCESSSTSPFNPC